MPELTETERHQVAEILKRRANEIAIFKSANEMPLPLSGNRTPELPASVEFALSREIDRLRRLADRINPPKPIPDEEG